MNSREAIRIIEKDGWFLKRTKGSHRVYKHPSKKGSVVVSGHGAQDLAIGTLRDIFDKAGIDVRAK